MIGLIAENPDEFRPGRPFTAESVKAFVLRIRAATEELGKKAISRSRFISLFLSFEEHIIESKYSQVVLTDNAVYKALEKKILSETASHKAKLNSLKGGL